MNNRSKTGHSLDAAQGDLLLGLLEDLGQINAGKIRNDVERDIVLRFVLDSIGLAQDIFFSDTEEDLQGVVERAALAREYVKVADAKFDVLNALSRKNITFGNKGYGANDPA